MVRENLLTPEIIASRPLFDPEPDNFVAKAALKDFTIKRCRISDFCVVAFKILIKEKHVATTEVNFFETAFQHSRGKDTQIRFYPKHEGHAAYAPNGTIMYREVTIKRNNKRKGEKEGDIKIEPWNGGRGNRKHGKWTIENVNECPGYKEWLAKLKQGVDDVEEDLANTPYPDRRACEEANAMADQRNIEADIEEKKKAEKRKANASKKKLARRKQTVSDHTSDGSGNDEDDLDDHDEESDEDTEQSVNAPELNTAKQRKPQGAAKDNTSSQFAKDTVQENTHGQPVPQNSHRVGAKLRRQADEKENDIVKLAEQYAESLDPEFFNGGEKIYRGENLVTKIAEAFGLNVNFETEGHERGSQDEHSNANEGGEDGRDEGEESVTEERRKKRARHA